MVLMLVLVQVSVAGRLESWRKGEGDVKLRLGVMLAVVALLGGLAAPASADTITFESVPLGTAVPFSSTAGSTTATFSSPDGAVFIVGPFVLGGNFLYDNDPALHRLDILFDQTISSVSLRFALNAQNSTQTFMLEAWSGASMVGSASATGLIPLGGILPEGIISFDSSGTMFDSVRLTSTAVDFAIDDVSVRAAVPDAGSTLLLLSAGLIGLRAWRRPR